MLINAGSIPVWGSETFFWVSDKAWVANSLLLNYQAASQFNIYRERVPHMGTSHWDLLIFSAGNLDFHVF